MEAAADGAHAGEKSAEIGTFHCQRYKEAVRVQKGKIIPEMSKLRR
jgi:hypothetical protein